ncbi:MAG: formylglycine-generating enzyme family protein [Kiritimatiellia bacterium]
MIHTPEGQIKRYLAGMVLAAGSVSLPLRAVEVPEEPEKPGINTQTAAAIAAYATNPCPETVESIRAAVAANYDAVVERKTAKLHELDGTAGAGTPAQNPQIVEEMREIIEDMILFKDYRVGQNVRRFTDARFGKTHGNGAAYNEPDEDGFIPLLGAASDLFVAYTPVTNAAFAQFDPNYSFAPGHEGHPAVNIAYTQAVAYCEWLTAHSPNLAYRYRLPTEAEWELAAGHMPKDASINSGGVESGTTDVFAYFEAYESRTVSLSGTLDMWGNVWEWLATESPAGEQKIKGGAYDSDRSDCRTEERGNSRPADRGYGNVGFRILRENNRAAGFIRDARSANWMMEHYGRALLPTEYRLLENDSDGDGFPDWQEGVAMTNPFDPESRLTASIGWKSESPSITWNPARIEGRRYRLLGKASPAEDIWIEVRGNASLYTIFKVEVDLD